MFSASPPGPNMSANNLDMLSKITYFGFYFKDSSPPFFYQRKALEDREVAENEDKKREEHQNDKIYDTIDSEDQKKIDELYEKKPISS